MSLSKIERRKRIKYRIRNTISGTTTCPRLSVFRSNKEIYAQLIDDITGKTLVSASSIDKSINKSNSKTDVSIIVGKLLAKRAIALNFSRITFDRNGYLYHGRVKALADGARTAGLKF